MFRQLWAAAANGYLCEQNDLSVASPSSQAAFKWKIFIYFSSLSSGQLFLSNQSAWAVGKQWKNWNNRCKSGFWCFY
jgi:hypothetical protein